MSLLSIDNVSKTYRSEPDRPSDAAGEQPAGALGEQPQRVVGERPAWVVGERPAWVVGEQPAWVLRGVSLALDCGECMAVWGERSSGKTTLLQLAAGLQVPELGTVRLGGHEVRRADGCSAGLLGGQIGWADGRGLRAEGLQALDCVALPLIGASCSPRVARARAWEALSLVGMAHRGQTYCERLSSAERTLTSIAKAIAHEPTLLLADDPAGHLVQAERESIMSLLRELAQARSLAVLVTVSHIASMTHAHRAASLAHGRLLTADRPVTRIDNVIDLSTRRYAVV